MKLKKLDLLGVIALFSGVALISAAGVRPANAEVIANTGFESANFTGWNVGPQTGSLSGGTITGSGTGVTLIGSPVSFNSPARGAFGNPTLPDGTPNPYYQPPVTENTWSFAPYGTYAAALQPNTQQTFAQAMAALGLTPGDQTALQNELSVQAAASQYGSGTPKDASWITRTVSLTAGLTYTMSWNYIGTDYVPFNDGSITSLTPVSGSPTISVNNTGGQFALLGFTNPGTGDYSTGTYGSTGWQMSTYQVSQTGDYVLGFAVFNLDDFSLSPVLLVDSQPGSTTKNGEDFGAVPPNNSDAPTVPPASTEPPSTEPPATDAPVTDPPATEPPATDPPATDPPSTEPPATDPPSTEAPVETDPPSTDVPVETDPPVTEAPEESVTTTDAPRPRPRPRPTTTSTTFPETSVPLIPEVSAPGDSLAPVDSIVPPSSGPSSSAGTPSLPITGSENETSLSVAVWLMLIGGVLLAYSRVRKRAL